MSSGVQRLPVKHGLQLSNCYPFAFFRAREPKAVADPNLLHNQPGALAKRPGDRQPFAQLSIIGWTEFAPSGGGVAGRPRGHSDTDDGGVSTGRTVSDRLVESHNPSPVG